MERMLKVFKANQVYTEIKSTFLLIQALIFW